MATCSKTRQFVNSEFSFRPENLSCDSPRDVYRRNKYVAKLLFLDFRVDVSIV